MTIAQAGINTSMFSIGGLAGGLVLISSSTDLEYFRSLSFFLVGAPLVAMMASSDVSPATLVAIMPAPASALPEIISASMPPCHDLPDTNSLDWSRWAQAVGRVGSLGGSYYRASCWRCHLRNKYCTSPPQLCLGSERWPLRLGCDGALAVLEVSDLMNRLRSRAPESPQPIEGLVPASSQSPAI